MGQVPEIDAAEAAAAHREGSATFLDIRDPATHAQGAIDGAVHLDSQEAFDAFVGQTPKAQAIIVYCYHGNSSKMVTQMLLDADFQDVRSLRGGYEGWRTLAE